MRNITIITGLFLISNMGYSQDLPVIQTKCDFSRPTKILTVNGNTNKLYKCDDGKFNVAVLKGNYSEINFAHGALLAEESMSGVIDESLYLVNSAISSLPDAAKPAVRNLIDCFAGNLFDSLSDEFKGGVENYYRGLKQELGQKLKFSKKDLILASVGIELDNILGAVSRQSTPNVLKTVGAYCGKVAPKAALNTASAIFSGLFKNKSQKGIGCTAFSIPESKVDNKIEGLIFGRTLDAELMRSWNNSPTIFVIHEKGYLPYVSTGSAGMIYPGGITGFNSQGLSVSLHQMYATDAVLKDKTGQAAIAPFIQQMILREAASIPEIIELVKTKFKKIKPIASWTILASDAKSGLSARIEITVDGMIVQEIRSSEKAMAQTNHFFSESTKARAFFPNFNKVNESFTRFNTLTKALDNHNNWTIQEAVAQLANHLDFKSNFQPFGTTSVKAYDVMSTVMVPKTRKIWMTAGDFSPSPHASYIGINLTPEFEVQQQLPSIRDQNLANSKVVLGSLNAYVNARLYYEQGEKIKAEQLLRKTISNLESTLAKSDSATEKLQIEGSLRVYKYILFRVVSGRLIDSKSTSGLKEVEKLAMDSVLSQPENHTQYQWALAAFFLAWTEQKINGKVSSLNISRLKEAINIFQNSRLSAIETFKIDSLANVDSRIEEISENIANGKKILAGESPKKYPSVDWVVLR